jgi:PPM family protein phosphatase
MNVETASKIFGADGEADDRVGIFTRDRVVLLAVADGAGGQSGGAAAAQCIVDRAAERFRQPGEVNDPVLWVAWMRDLDRDIEADRGLGESTAVVCLVEDGQFLCGCSVGDSEGLLITPDAVVDLTRGQKRKPLIGSGRAQPQGFFVRRTVGTLLLGTDGLFKYATRDRITDVVRRESFAELLDRLVAAVRLPSGALQDDVGLVAFRTY